MGVIMLLYLPVVAMAQGRNLPTRQQLDSLVNPKQSTKAAGALRVDGRHKNIGTIGAEDVVRVTFTLHNIASQPVTITQLRSSCSCFKVVTKPTVIDVGGMITVEAHFNPEGRNGGFRQKILLYTDLDDKLPTEQLTIEGVIENDDKWLHLPYCMGELRMSRKEMTITSRGEERISVANSGDKPMRLRATTTVAGLYMRTEPEIINPGMEGDIVVVYDNEPIGEINTILIIEGINAMPSERMIKVKIKR